MTPAATPVGSSSPNGDAAGMDEYLAVERVKASDEKLDDAFAALSSLLLDIRTAHAEHANRLSFSAPLRAPPCPDAARRRMGRPSPTGGEAA